MAMVKEMKVDKPAATTKPKPAKWEIQPPEERFVKALPNLNEWNKRPRVPPETFKCLVSNGSSYSRLFRLFRRSQHSRTTDIIGEDWKEWFANRNLPERVKKRLERHINSPAYRMRLLMARFHDCKLIPIAKQKKWCRDIVLRDMLVIHKNIMDTLTPMAEKMPEIVDSIDVPWCDYYGIGIQKNPHGYWELQIKYILYPWYWQQKDRRDSKGRYMHKFIGPGKLVLHFSLRPGKTTPEYYDISVERLTDFMINPHANHGHGGGACLGDASGNVSVNLADGHYQRAMEHIMAWWRHINVQDSWGVRVKQYPNCVWWNDTLLPPRPMDEKLCEKYDIENWPKESAFVHSCDLFFNSEWEPGWGSTHPVRKGEGYRLPFHINMEVIADSPEERNQLFNNLTQDQREQVQVEIEAFRTARAADRAKIEEERNLSRKIA